MACGSARAAFDIGRLSSCGPESGRRTNRVRIACQDSLDRRACGASARQGVAALERVARAFAAETARIEAERLDPERRGADEAVGLDPGGDPGRVRVDEVGERQVRPEGAGLRLQSGAAGGRLAAAGERGELRAFRDAGPDSVNAAALVEGAGPGERQFEGRPAD